ncbi:hypothetical protein F751_5045 [Auxenochlorella protothecoides]|uniref:THO complex subunit 7-like protein n=1 Tax=Auxenochlorella protothecoides TaxID=3075 RepID=A0A087SEP9_AUXPR|nr:hypothetical protein F751_5045 [Auxenochlorella protothecoides]KFM24203.1 hypothetical protein F751_5045 [Auxenochlorella protothecoides]
MAATMEEEAIIKYRYLTQTVSTTANVLPPMKSLARRFFQFRTALTSGTAAEARALYDDLLRRLEAGIAATRGGIEAARRELAAAQADLRHAREYEALRRSVVALAPRSATRREMDGACREIGDLQAQARGLEEAMARRRAALTGLLAVAAGVAAELESEALAEEGALPETEMAETVAGPAALLDR